MQPAHQAGQLHATETTPLAEAASLDDMDLMTLEDQCPGQSRSGRRASRTPRAHAQQVLAGYAFGTLTTGRRRWAYQSYDCVPASDGPLDAHDILTTAGLNSRIGASATLGLLAASDQILDRAGDDERAPQPVMLGKASKPAAERGIRAPEITY